MNSNKSDCNKSNELSLEIAIEKCYDFADKLNDEIYSMKIMQEYYFAIQMKGFYDDKDIYNKIKAFARRDFRLLKSDDAKKRIFQDYKELFVD